MKRSSCIILFLALLVPITVQVIFAQNNDPKTDVMKVLKPNVEQTLAVVQNSDLSLSEKKAKIETIADPLFEYQLMGKLVLGKQHWPKLNDEQRERYVQLFTRIMKVSYFSKIKEVGNVDVQFKDPVQKGKNKVYVPTVVEYKDEAINVEYRLFRAGSEGSWKIFDVVIKGVSIIKSYNSQYSDFLKNHTVDELLDKMKQKVKELNAQDDESESK